MSARTNSMSSFKITPPPLNQEADAGKEIPQTPKENAIKEAGEASLSRDPSMKIKGASCGFEGCRKSLSLFDKTQKCRCEQTFCGNHRFYLDHKCTFNYQDAAKRDLLAGLNKEYKPRHFHHQSGRGCPS